MEKDGFSLSAWLGVFIIVGVLWTVLTGEWMQWLSILLFIAVVLHVAKVVR